MRFLFVSLVVFLNLILPSNSIASNDTSKTGDLLLGAGIGISRLGGVGGDYKTREYAGSLNLSGRYFLNKNLAIGASWQRSGHGGKNDEGFKERHTDIKIEALTIDAMLMRNEPGEFLKPYLIVGIGTADTDIKTSNAGRRLTSDSGSQDAYSVGFGVYFGLPNEGFYQGLEFRRVVLDDTDDLDLNYLNYNLGYKF